jgi:hypothetical protein
LAKIIKEQAKSGVSQTQFCKARDINPKYFSLLKSKHASKVSPFIKAGTDIPPATSVDPRVELILPQGTLRFAATIPPHFIATLVTSLG